MPFFRVPDGCKGNRQFTTAIHAEFGATRVTWSPGVDREVAARPRRQPSPGVTDLTPNRPVRLLDVVEGRSGTMLASWLAERAPAWRGRVSSASLDPVLRLRHRARSPAARRGAGAAACEDDGHPQTRLVVATIVGSLACSSVVVRVLPRMEVANPHCGDRRRSSGMWMRVSSSSILVPATQREAEPHARVVSEDDVVEFEVEVEPALGWLACAGVEVAVGGVEQQWVVGSVELDVVAA
jgi:hypothetical protein